MIAATAGPTHRPNKAGRKENSGQGGGAVDGRGLVGGGSELGDRRQKAGCHDGEKNEGDDNDLKAVRLLGLREVGHGPHVYGGRECRPVKTASASFMRTGFTVRMPTIIADISPWDGKLRTYGLCNSG